MASAWIWRRDLEIIPFQACVPAQQEERDEEERSFDRCGSCSGRGEIFQATGNYCIDCWQKETHPDV